MEYIIEDRCVIMGRYIAESGDTVRGCAQKFGVSKSTVHKDVTERLKKTNPSLYSQVCAVLFKNKSERHIRGGIATKNKYLMMSEYINGQKKEKIKT